MKIAIIGTGGVGGYYGGLLARQGHNVTFIARGVHLKAIQENGLQVKSVHGDFQIIPAQATDNPADIGHVELVLFCTKTYATLEAVQLMIPIIGSNTTVMSLQNGVGAAGQIGSIIGMSHMLGAATWISASVEAPGIIRQVSRFRRVVLGELDGSITARAQDIFSIFQETGITIELSENISNVLWTKFVFISAISSLGSLTRLPLGEYRHVAETRSMMVALMKEIEAVAKANKVELDENVIAKSLDFIDNAAPTIKPSMQLDVELGHRFELESMVGEIVHLGQHLGITTPTADMIYAALLPLELKARG